MIPISLFAGVLVLLSGFSVSVWAHDKSDCPKKIATIQEGVLSPFVQKILKDLYLELGCPVEFMPLPGRRGIRYFNHNLADGELIRMEKAEMSYSRAYVRSSVPLFSLTYSLWRHPDDKGPGESPIAFTLGIIWQENYMKDHFGKRFYSAEGLVKAYNTKVVSNFLMADFSVRLLAGDGKIKPHPIRTKVIQKTSMYHYLDKRFAPFMKRLSALVKTRDPFAHISRMQE